MAEYAISAFFQGKRVRLLLIFFLVAIVIAEGYYIHLLRVNIARRNDELINISLKLQHVKTEREALKADITSAKKTGDAGNENTSAGQY